MARRWMLVLLVVVVAGGTVVGRLRMGPESPDVVISEVVSSNATSLVDQEGESSDWIEIWNRSTRAVDLTGWRLSDREPADDNAWRFPRVSLEAGDRLLIFASGKADRWPLHTDFRLSADGEYLSLRDQNGQLIDEFSPIPPLGIDTSFGIDRDGELGPLVTPTPGRPNSARQLAAAAKPTLSRGGGYIDSAVTVSATTATEGAELWYTTDGSTPTTGRGTRYTAPITIDRTTTLRMVATHNSFGDSVVAAATFLVLNEVLAQSGTPQGWSAEPVNLQVYQYGLSQQYLAQHRAAVTAALQAAPTLSITTDLANLIDPDIGIYSNAQESGLAWERPVSIELIDGDSDGDGGFQINGGLRIKGGFSRGPHVLKHNFRLVFSHGYERPLTYPLFAGDGPATFASVDLRSEQNYSWNIGSNQHTMMRDQFTRDTQAAVGEPATRSRWVHLFLNGQYWGLYMLRDDVTAEHAAATWGGSENDYDVVKHSDAYGYEVADGDDDEWLQLWDAIADGELSDAEYATVDALTDLDNLAAFMMVKIAVGNFDSVPSVPLQDFRGNNWQAVRGNGQQFQFFADDCEIVLGAGEHNLDFDVSGPYPITRRNPFWMPEFFNPAWLHQVLLTRSEYRTIFGQLAATLLADDGALGTQASRDRWLALREQIDPLIEAEAARWGRHGDFQLGRQHWEAEVAWIGRVWFAGRPDIVLAQLAALDITIG